MADAILGLGSVVKADYTLADTFVAVGECINFTPPGRARRGVDATTLDSTLALEAAGVEDFSEFTFTQRWEPDDTQHLLVDASFGATATDKYQILFVDDGATVWEFSGFISNLSAESIDQDSILSRTVTVQRTTAIEKDPA